MDDVLGYGVWIGGAAVLGGLIYLAVLESNAVKAACEAKGGKIISQSASGVGVGFSGSGNAVVVPTTSTVSFCLSPDGRILQ